VASSAGNFPIAPRSGATSPDLGELLSLASSCATGDAEENPLQLKDESAEFVLDAMNDESEERYDFAFAIMSKSKPGRRQ
tara:strand:+ start:769 stop:1008 length:240 start_codon:yes stop_codon:yes gene_type:complete